ncbi:hypothetical protein BD408DRAFT_58187 [Parasitella parasitica]|nr:hypothetical protein BD408DRAFT_58187 [Parasitella parasitica]
MFNISDLNSKIMSSYLEWHLSSSPINSKANVVQNLKMYLLQSGIRRAQNSVLIEDMYSMTFIVPHGPR